MDLATWLTLIGILLLGAMAPGPSLGVVIQNTARGGQSQGLLTSIAHAVGVGCYALLAALGLVMLIAKAPLLFGVLQIAGALFLAYLGYGALTAKAADEDVPEVAVHTHWDSISSGFLTAFLNPKIALVFLALFSQFVTPETSLSTKWLMAVTALIVDGSWYCLVVSVVSYSGALERFRGQGMLVQRVFGALLVLIALRVAAPVLGFG